MIRGKFIALNGYTRKKERLKVTKGELISRNGGRTLNKWKSKRSTRKKLLMIKSENNEKKPRLYMEKNQKSQKSVPWKSWQIDRLMKRKRKETRY